MDQQEQRSVAVEKKSDYFKIILSILVVLLIVSNIFTVFILFSQIKQEDPGLNGYVPPPTTIIDDEEEGLELTANEINVEWNNWPVKITSALAIFGDKLAEKSALVASNENFVSIYGSLNSFIYQKTSFYDAGIIAEGPYQGKTIYLAALSGEGPSTFGLSRVINNDGDLIIIKNESTLTSLEWVSYGALFTLNELITIQNIENNPDSISIPNTNKYFTKAPSDTKKLLSDYNAEEVLTVNGTTIYQDVDNNCFVTGQNDQTAVNYILNLDFVGEQSDDGSSYLGLKPYTLDVTFNDGSVTDNEYLFHGAVHFTFNTGCYDYAHFITNDSQLSVVGHTASGENIYALADQNIKEKESDTKPLLQTMYDRMYNPSGETKISYAAFLADYPVLLWKDPFGKYVIFRNAEYVPAAEMGKPVIYLYPEETTDVSVKVTPNKGLTITEPEYKDGWFVRAEPNGDLYNYDDKKSYPYLFWEGWGINYAIPEQGFVVAKENVTKFLAEKLAQQGLIPTEYDEFIDFWAPKMQDKAYYFITFVPQEEFNLLAPLEVVPQPDTIIRVFMDYKGLDKKINVEPQILETPIREGFVVTEWGGALR